MSLFLYELGLYWNGTYGWLKTPTSGFDRLVSLPVVPGLPEQIELLDFIPEIHTQFIRVRQERGERELSQAEVSALQDFLRNLPEAYRDPLSQARPRRTI